MSDPSEAVLFLTSAVRAAKAAVGPTAWAVLEELLLEAAPAENGQLLARASVRGLGSALGLDKDTVARALQRLCAGGFVARCSDANAGGRSCYVIAAVTGVSRVGPPQHFTGGGREPMARPRSGDRDQRRSGGDSGRSTKRRASGSERVTPGRSDQLSLLDASAALDIGDR